MYLQLMAQVRCIGMKEGEVRRLNIGYEFAYGEEGIPGVIPEKSNVKNILNNEILIAGVSYKVIGRATGGNYGFRVKKSLAIAMVKPEFSNMGTELEMDILDKKHKVTVIEDSPYDPMNKKIRA